MTRLVVHPGETVTFETFRAVPAPAVALDGYVAGATRVDRDGHANFNHHDGSDRFTTRATCAQVALALQMGSEVLGRPGCVRDDLAIHVNDTDPDVCLSVWLLRHPDAVYEPEVGHLVALEDAIDTSGGVCLAGVADDLDRLAWVIDPWVAERTGSAPVTAVSAEAVIDAVAERIDAWRAGRAERVDVAAGFDIIERRRNLAAVIEHHPLARARLVAEGVGVFVSWRNGPTPGTSTVSIGKVSPFSPFDLDSVWATLNELDGCEGVDRWGGGNMIGGSPRAAGTRLGVSEVLDVVDAELAAAGLDA